MCNKAFRKCLLSMGFLLVISVHGNLMAQEVFKTSTVTPYDIYNMDTGPATTEVVMVGYTDTDQYHQTRYVSATTGSDANGDGTRGRPWASIGHALDQIDDARLSNRHAILVAAGEYRGTTLQMKEYVHLYGGFNPVGWERDIHIHKSILDGGGQHRIMKCDDHAKVDGFHFQNGVIRGNGGAIKCNGDAPVISNNVFRWNKSLIPEGWDPEFLHEIAHDGGAIAAINGAAPHILNNLFVENETECGRGAGVAAHNRSAPLIAYNVFLDNVAGTNDPMRSSDGGAISSAFFSPADIYYNVVVGNRAENDNDAGGIFSELWSSVHIAGNLVVGNFADDDGGGLYLSGQVHHYITEPDPVVPEERYLSRLAGNVIIGNTNPGGGRDSGFRFTNDTRVAFDRNVTFSNYGGLDFRRSMVTGRDNIFFDNVTVRESDQTARFYNSLILGELEARSDTELIDSEKVKTPPEPGSSDFGSYFRNDGTPLQVTGTRIDSDRPVTILSLGETPEPGRENTLVNRVIRIGDQWTTVKSAGDRTITIWGTFDEVDSVDLIPTFTLHPESAFNSDTMGSQ